jgi:hypothetical protein
MPTAADALALARFARACIASELGGPTPAPPHGGVFDAPGASFVSLHWIDGRLQGCIGTLEAHRSLVADVARNAKAAAFTDPRAHTLEAADVVRLDVEVSILSPLERITFADESEALAALRPGTDGVVFVWRTQRATFIPQMWTHIPDPAEFLAELKQKAGFPPGFWDADVELWRYTAVIAVDPATRG